MTLEDLRNLIASDEQASSLAAAGNDTACAVRCCSIADPAPYSRLIGELGILALFANPVDGATVLGKLNAVSESNPIVAIAVKWIQPGAPGIDLGHASTRAMLEMLRDADVFTETEYATLKLAGEQQPIITDADVSAAMLGDRPDGRVA